MMAYYVTLDENNFVLTVAPGVDEYELLDNLHPEIFYAKVVNKTVKRTSYNTFGGVHYTNGQQSQDQSKAFRKNYAGIGYYYDSIRDAFIPPKPYPSWILDEFTCLWQSPIPYPNDGKMYQWNEEIGNWIEINLTR